MMLEVIVTITTALNSLRKDDHQYVQCVFVSLIHVPLYFLFFFEFKEINNFLFFDKKNKIISEILHNILNAINQNYKREAQKKGKPYFQFP